MSGATPAHCVSLAACSDYAPQRVQSALAELLQPLGGMAAFVHPGTRVLLKPNLVVGRQADQAVNTHPALLRAVALAVIEAGARPIVGDSPAFGTAASVCRACGIAEVADELQLEIVDLSRRARPRPLGPGSPWVGIRFGADALEADTIINLPKVKAHCQTGLTGAVKNLYGCVSGKRKPFYHFRSRGDLDKFCRFLCAIARHLSPVLSIADGVIGLERYGPSRGDPRALGFLAAAAHPVALDHVIARLLGVDPAGLPVLRAAQALEYGPDSIRDIELLGAPIDALARPDFVPVAPEDQVPIAFSATHLLRSILRQALLRARGQAA